MKKIVIGEEIESPMKKGYNFTLSFSDNIERKVVIAGTFRAHDFAEALLDNMYAMPHTCTKLLKQFLPDFEWPKCEDDYCLEYLSFDIKYVSGTGTIHSASLEEVPNE